MNRFSLILSAVIVILVSCSKELAVFHPNPEGLVNDQGLASKDSELSGPYSLSNGLTVFKEGDYFRLDDMLFSAEMIEKQESVLTRSFASQNVSSYWPSRKVYYSFDSSVDYSFKQTILSVMNEIADSSGVIFLPKTMSVHDYIVFKRANVGSSRSYVGVKGGEQEIVIVTPFYNPTTIHHEIFHALGFYHEHQRSDRNSYITIYSDNIKDNYLPNFDIVNGIEIGPYDLSSIMHYGSLTNDTTAVYNTSVPLLTGVNGDILPGAHYGMSVGDIQGLRSVYGPPFHRLEKITTVYQDGIAGSNEIYDVYTETCIRFYEDESCTSRMPLAYPRKITLRAVEYSCGPGSNGDVKSLVSYFTVNIPAGVDTFLIDSRRNVEYYYNSNAVNIDSKYYTIEQPRHLQDVELFVDD